MLSLAGKYSFNSATSGPFSFHSGYRTQPQPRIRKAPRLPLGMRFSKCPALLICIALRYCTHYPWITACHSAISGLACPAAAGTHANRAPRLLHAAAAPQSRLQQKRNEMSTEMVGMQQNHNRAPSEWNGVWHIPSVRTAPHARHTHNTASFGIAFSQRGEGL